MNDRVKILVKGNIKITRSEDSKILFESSNNILPGALEVLVKNLTNLGGDMAINTITANGDFGNSIADVVEVEYPNSNQITLSAIFTHQAFTGTIDSFELSSPIGTFAEKTGLSIFKDDHSRLRVDWTITLN